MNHTKRFARTVVGFACAASLFGALACGSDEQAPPPADDSVVDAGPTLATGPLTDCQAALQVSSQMGQYLQLYQSTADLRSGDAELPSAVPLGFIDNSAGLARKMDDAALRTVVTGSVTAQKSYNAALAADDKGKVSKALGDQSKLFDTALGKCASSLSGDDSERYDEIKAAYKKGFPAG